MNLVASNCHPHVFQRIFTYLFSHDHVLYRSLESKISLEPYLPRPVVWGLRKAPLYVVYPQFLGHHYALTRDRKFFFLWLVSLQTLGNVVCKKYNLLETLIFVSKSLANYDSGVGFFPINLVELIEIDVELEEESNEFEGTLGRDEIVNM
jgi:hypothetical protein